MALLNNEQVASQIGDFVENAVGKRLSRPRRKPSNLGPKPRKKTWYAVPLEKGLSGDGSEYHIYVSKGTTDKLCIILSGGGVAWNDFTAARPVTGGRVAAGLPNYYWNNLRPFTQIMNIHIGITDKRNPLNPFADWNCVVITYSTGDFHIGQSTMSYADEDGKDATLHFHGYENFRESMKVAKKLFPNPSQILLAGNSAGAFAVPALAPDVKEDFYPDCQSITLFSDSGQLLYADWAKTARDLWHAKEEIVAPLCSDNITLDWYRDLYRRYGDAFQYLYGSSIRDYLLSTYYNDMAHKIYGTNSEVQEIFYQQLCTMVKELKELNPHFTMYLYDMTIPGITQGGTVHTALKELYFTTMKSDGVTMAKWLNDATEGNLYDVGLSLLDSEH